MTIEVRFVYQVYQNEKNQYTVSKYRNQATGKSIVCTGTALPTFDIPYVFEVEEVNDKKYGKQYKVISYKEFVETSKNGIVAYLSCGLFKGIGAKTAELIYKEFGDKTLDVIHNDIDKLINVKGITKKKLDKIKDSYAKNLKYRDITEFLSPYGFTPKQIVKIADVIERMSFLQGTILDNLKRNPYLMCYAEGIGFNQAEILRIPCGIKQTDDYRIYAAARQAIKSNLLSGTVGVKPEDLIKEMLRLLRLPGKPEELNKFAYSKILNMIKYEKLSYRKVLINGNVVTYFYLPEYLKAETALAKHVSDKINASKRKNKIDNLDELIDKFSCGIVLDESQREAIHSAFENKLSIITGGPGSGKTTIIKIISDIYGCLYPKNNQTFLAPTGRASRRITESTQNPAQTIHAKFELSVHDGDNEYTENRRYIEEGLVVVDEFSMVDMMLAELLFRSVSNECQMVIVGDINQLMSVGAGAVLNDLIASGCIPVAKLRFSHRQANGSLIAENAELIVKGETDLFEGPDFVINDYDLSNTEEMMLKIEDDMVKSVLKEIKKFGKENVVCLCPYKKHAGGVYSMNRRLQAELNPLTKGEKEIKLLNDMYAHEGDIVMHLKNSDDVLNGDIGVVKSVYVDGKDVCMICHYTDAEGNIAEVEYSKDNIEEVTLAYAMTVHKSQGSEYASVVTCLTDFHSVAKKRNLIYTAITRAKKNVKVFCSRKALNEAILNNAVEERNTLLAYAIREAQGIVSKEEEQRRKDEERKRIEATPEYQSNVKHLTEYIKDSSEMTETKMEELKEKIRKGENIWQQQKLALCT